MSETNGAAPKPAGNGFDAQKTLSFIERIEDRARELESAKSDYMLACKEIREDIKDIYGEAKDAGVPKKELKAVVKTRAMARKLEAIRDDLEQTSQDTYDMIRHAIGDLADTPLGAAALAKAPDAPAFAG